MYSATDSQQHYLHTSNMTFPELPASGSVALLYTRVMFKVSSRIDNIRVCSSSSVCRPAPVAFIANFKIRFVDKQRLPVSCASISDVRTSHYNHVSTIA